MGSKLGVLKIAAKRLGLRLEEYTTKLEAGLKWCIRCRSWKPLGEFGTDNSRGDTKASRCVDCRRTGTRPGPGKSERRKKRAAGLAWCRACRAWKPTRLVHAGLCRPCTNAAIRHRYAADLQYRLNRRQHAHSRKRQVAPIPAHAQLLILEEFAGKCAYCRVVRATTWDHIVPTSRHGRTTPGNVVPACASCNSSKKNQDVWIWMEKRGLTPSDELINRYILSECGLFG
jgi:5-methylcytosine-specific restriction endonuclease McrA